MISRRAGSVTAALVAVLIANLTGCTERAEAPQPSPQAQVVSVPDLIGLTGADAVRQAQGLGFTVTLRGSSSDPVYAQIPAGGSKLIVGSAVVIETDEASQEGDTAQDYGPGFTRVGRLFLSFARGQLEGPPVDTPVALYLGNTYQRTIPDGQSDQRSQWQVCDAYAQHECPMSALDVLAATAGNVRITDSVLGECFDTSVPPPTNTGGSSQVVLSPSAPATCAEDYSVQIWVNDEGQITAVNLLLASES